MQPLSALTSRARSTREESPAGRSGPSVGIIIPAYGHSEYMAGALASALVQQGIVQSVVLVVDGCRHPETYRRAYCWAAADDHVTVLVKRNMGLSGARNSGIEYFRQARPDVDYIYFLDADNAIGPYALGAAAQQLANAPAEVAWVYPDIRTAGIFQENLCARNYSRLAHLGHNVCEAGSLIRAEVLWESGVRFDEQMRAGYEDWDFWLQLVELGYTGAHCPELVLNYRRRPASMLASSQTMDEELRSYLRRKHKALYQAKRVLAFDREDAPRYLSYLVDEEAFRLHHHPAEPREILSVARCAERIRLFQDQSPVTVPVGKAVCFTAAATYSALTKASVAGALLHRVERLLDSGARLVSVDLIEDSSTVSISEVQASASAAERGHLHVMSPHLLAEVLNDRSNDWLRGVMLRRDGGLMKRLQATIPSDAYEVSELAELDVEEVLSVISKMRRIGFTARPIGLQRPTLLWGLQESGATAATVLRTRTPYNNARPEGRPVAAITLPISAFSGMERVAHQMARVLRNEGFYTQLFIAWDAHADSSRLLRLAFDEIVPLGLGRSGTFSGPAYLGTPTFSNGPADADKLAELYSCLLGADVVINCHVPEVHALAARLRRHGIMTISGLQVFDLTPAQRPVGHPYLAVAYEHGYDRIAVPSHDLRDKLLGLGVPGSKIIVVPNSVGVPEELVAGLVNRPGPVCAAGTPPPLRCLFAGRFDRQKGIDRLVHIVEALKRRNEPVSWSAVGGEVLADRHDRALLDSLVGLGVTCKPPIYDEQEMVKELSGADILVLPSYFEGVPLVMVEAMRLGLVPVATRVGGIGELVSDGLDGFLVASDASTEVAMCEVIARLARMPRQALAGIGRAAAARAGAITWAASMAPLMVDIREHLEDRARRAAKADRPDRQDAHVLTFGG